MKAQRREFDSRHVHHFNFKSLTFKKYYVNISLYMKVIRKNILKSPAPVYVVTRGGRRVEEVNYKTQNDAIYRADILVDMVKKYSPHEKDSVHVVYTSSPERIR